MIKSRRCTRAQPIDQRLGTPDTPAAIRFARAVDFVAKVIASLELLDGIVTIPPKTTRPVNRVRPPEK